MSSIAADVSCRENIVRVRCFEEPIKIATWRIGPEDCMNATIGSDHRLQTRFELGNQPARVGKYGFPTKTDSAKVIVRIEVKLLIVSIRAKDDLTIIHDVAVIELGIRPTQSTRRRQ